MDALKEEQIDGKTLKVLLYVPGFDVGGIETYLLNLIEGLNRNNKIEIILLCRVINNKTQLFERLSSLDVRIIDLGVEHLNLKTLQRFAHGVDCILKKEHFDVLHIHTYKEPYIIDSAKRHGVRKIILHVHVINPSESISESRSIVKRLVEKKNIKRSNVIMAPSKEIFESCIKQFKDKKLVFAPNCIDTKVFAFNESVRNIVREKLGIEDNEIVIGHVGRFTEVKNHRFLINVFFNICNKTKSRLLLIGDGPLQEEMKVLVKGLKMENNVIFLGRRDDISDLINGFDYFVFPSFYEGFGISLIEAQCNGLPCVVSDTLSNDAIITDLVRKKSLNESAQMWGDYICAMKMTINRNKYAYEVMNAGYGMDSISEPVERVYLER